MKFKRLTALVVALCSIATIGFNTPSSVNVPYIVAKAETSTDDFIFDSEEGKIIKYIGYDKEVVIPEEIDGVTVTSIADKAFYNYNRLLSITIPDTVTSIGSSTFYGCNRLSSMIVPDSVTAIENNTFYGCTRLTSITIPNSVTSIGDSAFYNCTGLTSVEIPDSVTTIGRSTFNGCSGLTSVTIPASVTSIGDGAFSGCSYITSITIPETVEYIGSQAFGYANSEKIEDFTVSGYKLSSAQIYAIENKFKFVQLSKKGDVNADGNFNVADVVLLQKWLLAYPDTELADWEAANLCEDDKLNASDLCMMKNKLIYG